MGLINNDPFTASNGVEKTGTYISFNNETIYLRKLIPSSSAYPTVAPGGQTVDTLKPYLINANYRVFWDKAAKDAGKSFIELRSISTTVSEEQLSGNLYMYLYEELKKDYPNSVDELSVKSTVPADSSATSSATSSASSTDPSAATDSTTTSSASSTDPSAATDSTTTSSASSTDPSAATDSTTTSSTPETMWSTIPTMSYTAPQ